MDPNAGGETGLPSCATGSSLGPAGSTHPMLTFAAANDYPDRRDLLIERGLLLPRSPCSTSTTTTGSTAGRRQTVRARAQGPEPAHGHRADVPDGSPWRVVHSLPGGRHIADYLRPDGTVYLRIPIFDFRKAETWPRKIRRVAESGESRDRSTRWVSGSAAGCGSSRWGTSARSSSWSRGASSRTWCRCRRRTTSTWSISCTTCIWTDRDGGTPGSRESPTPGFWTGSRAWMRWSRSPSGSDRTSPSAVATRRTCSSYRTRWTCRRPRRPRSRGILVGSRWWPGWNPRNAWDTRAAGLRPGGRIRAGCPLRHLRARSPVGHSGAAGPRARHRALRDAARPRPERQGRVVAGNRPGRDEQVRGVPAGRPGSMSHGCPVVSYDVVRAPGTDQRRRGRLPGPPGDTEALAERLIQLLESPELAQRMSRAATEKAKQHGKDEFVADWAAVLEKTVELKPSSNPPRRRRPRRAEPDRRRSPQSGPARSAAGHPRGRFPPTATVRLEATLRVKAQGRVGDLASARVELDAVLQESGVVVALPVDWTLEGSTFSVRSDVCLRDQLPPGDRPAGPLELRLRLVWRNSVWQGWLHHPSEIVSRPRPATGRTHGPTRVRRRTREDEV